MLKRARNWFRHLSKAGKIGTVGAGIFCLLVVSSALAGPQPTPICTASSRLTTETSAIPFDKTQVNDVNTDKGKTAITTAGVDGEKTTTSKVTEYSPSNCKPSTTTFIKDETTKQPLAEVTSIGTKEPAPVAVTPAPEPAPTQSGSCSPYYSPCVPNVSYDLDCSDIGMRVSVHGGDLYRLDADHDGIGCEAY